MRTLVVTHRRRSILSRWLAGMFCLGIAVFSFAGTGPNAAPPPGFKNYDTRYYVIQTDLTGDDVRETAVRMTKMAEEYHARTIDFSGVISQRLPFMLFTRKQDYYAAGGMPKSAGVFDGSKLMAIAGDNLTGRTWHVVQHEGFHQFAHAVIRGDLPIWVNEGLAEYFGEAVFTGDSFIVGVIPHSRMMRIKAEMKEAGAFMRVSRMMSLSHEDWNSQMTINNYDQAWSMVHFLAHGEDGKYQKAFSGYMRDIGRGVQSQKAWQQNFGDADGFEERWRDFWTKLPANPTLNLYLRADVATLTSFLARATAQKQSFDTFKEFADAISAKEIKQNDADWIPPALSVDAIALTRKIGKWSLEKVVKQPVVAMELDDGTRFTGSFQLRGSRVDRVMVDIDDTKVALAKADESLAAGKKDVARQLVQDAMRKNPKSPYYEQARKFLVDNK